MIKRNYVHPHVEICRDCEGRGFNIKETDPLLMGKGETVREPCKLCAGTGRVIISKVVETKILPFDEKEVNL